MTRRKTGGKKKTFYPPFVCGFLYAGRPAICIVDCAPTLPRVYWILSYLFRANTRGRRSPLFCAPPLDHFQRKSFFLRYTGKREREKGRSTRRGNSFHVISTFPPIHHSLLPPPLPYLRETSFDSLSCFSHTILIMRD